MTVHIKQYDSRYAIEATLSNESGAVDLTNTTIKFSMHSYSGSKVINRVAEIKDANNEVVWAILQGTDTAEAGMFKGEFTATFADGRKATFPSKDYVRINIQKGLGGE
ncbi:hypothetical protein J2Z83_000060 [Virgibacillus natechei]|uniref:BppU N-terminal domain-containing protein n=1 Tax=Virgibacillus natechei TaxID=1216297 RepID=A0ABS4IAK8_9BACI|nr:hypothetical protein [Virgibacillus natechei]MBP1967968.1 hypothetical protein [Virgibacillus natechei]UZD14744.1 hypothetical protein OLD84_09690 [Virgibacillus natechei]